MITILSPAKSLDFQSEYPDVNSSEPVFIDESYQLIKKLRSLSNKKIAGLMNLSKELTILNAERYAEWEPTFDSENSRPAIFAFNGEVYRNFSVEELNEDQRSFTADHLRILSGLHGVLKPFDRIRPYRLEMGTTLPVRRKKNLYQFWGDKVTIALNKALEESASDSLINLASTEYFKVVDFAKINGRVITPIFKDYQKGEYKVVMTWAKQARGKMAGFIMRNKILDPERLKDFPDYKFSASDSNETEWIFVRGNKS